MVGTNIAGAAAQGLEHVGQVLEDGQLQGGVADPPHDGAGLVRGQRVPQQDPGQQDRSVVGDVPEGQQDLVHLLEWFDRAESGIASPTTRQARPVMS